MEPVKLEQPILAVDVVVFRLGNSTNMLELLVIRRRCDPFAGAWALPGVAVQVDETLLQAARRALEDKTGVDPARLHLEQLATFDALYRDPRGRTVSVAHLGLARDHPDPGPDGRWQPVDPANHLPFDHDAIVNAAVDRLRGKLRYTNIAAALLPDRFTLDPLLALYRALVDPNINRANFRTKLLKIDMLSHAGVDEAAVGKRGGRPPHLYRFTHAPLAPEQRDFL